MLTFCMFLTIATIEAYNGKPPPWVYAEMSKVLICLSGLEGYQAMVRVKSLASLFVLSCVLIIQCSSVKQKRDWTR